MSAATVTAVTALAGAGVAAYSASQQAAAADAAGAGSPEDRYGTRVEPVPFGDSLGTEESLAPDLARDVRMASEESLPLVFEIANKVNAKARRQRDRMTGGAFSESILQEGANVNSMLQGQVPQDVVDSINRMVAENLGGAFNAGTPSVGGFDMSATAADTARRLGITSMDIMGRGHAMAGAWRSNVDSFVYKPQDAMAGFYLPQAELSMRLAENEYVSDNNIARAAAMPDPQVVGAANDALTQGAMQSQATRNMGGALVGLVNGVANTYSSIGSAGSYTGSGTAGSAGAVGGSFW